MKKFIWPTDKNAFSETEKDRAKRTKIRDHKDKRRVK